MTAKKRLEEFAEEYECFIQTLSISEVREMVNELPERISEVFDEAQGVVFTGSSRTAYVLIKIVDEEA